MRKLLALSLILFTADIHTGISTAAKSKQKMAEELASAVIDVLAPAPKDNEVCFSPDEPCVAKLIKFMETAKNSLDIAIFEITERHIATTIIEMSKKVKVRMVMNKRNSAQGKTAVQMLKDGGVKMRIGRQKGIMHNKFVIVDGKRLETGSFNYTYGASNSNQENQVYLSTPSIVSRFQDRFERMYREGKVRE